MNRRTVFQCREFESAEVPLALVLQGDHVDLYPEVTGRGYFDIDYRAGHIALVARSYVGLIPINDRVAVHVQPRFPIANLYYLLRRTSTKLHFVDRFLRSFDQDDDDFREPNIAFGRRLVRLLPHVEREGLLRRYIASTYHGPIGSGAIDFPTTVSRYRSQGIRAVNAWHENRLAHDIQENQLIKEALRQLLQFLSTRMSNDHRELRKQAHQLWTLFDQVGDRQNFGDLETWLPVAIQRLPRSHHAYIPALWLAFTLVARRAISVERIGAAVFDTFLINAADLFEDYVRILVQEAMKEMDLKVRNGNETPAPLFVSSDDFVVKPDIYVQSNGTTVAILDAKYKLDIKAADRYELLGFCEALDTRLSIAILPGIAEDEPIRTVGRTVGGVHLCRTNFNMAASPIPMEEARFKAAIVSAIRAETQRAAQ